MSAVLSRSTRVLVTIAILLALASVGAALVSEPASAATFGLVGASTSTDGPSWTDPSVQFELLSKRTEYSQTFQLADGSLQSVFYQSPINYRDANGDWQPINNTFEQVGSTETYVTAAAPVEVTIADEAPGQNPVTVASGQWLVTMNLVGCAEDDKTVTDESATYTGVATDTSVTYTALGDGVKELITLTSNAAPNVFTYRLTHTGLTPRQDETGQWGLYAADAAKPVFLLGSVNAHDSSLDEGDEPAWCDGARMTVTPGENSSTVTFTVPRTWLSDPARVYPVEIDPGVFTQNPTDTYISAGYPSTSYGSSQDLLCGKVSAATGFCQTLVKFPSLDDNNPVIPDGAHIRAATLSIRQYWQPTTHDDTIYVGRVTDGSTNWSDASTWNSTTIGIDATTSQSGATNPSWIEISCPGFVQGWERGDYANKGLVLHEGTTGLSYARKFRSGEFTDYTYRPKINVNYDTPAMSISSPAANSVSKIGDTVSVTVNVSGVEDPTLITDLRMGVNRAGSDTRYRGVMGWFSTKPAAPWVSVKKGAGSFIAYYDGSAYGNSDTSGNKRIDVQLANCTINADHTQAVFVFALTDYFGNIQDNDFDTYLAADAGSETWNTGWTNNNTNLDVTPKPNTGLTATQTSTAWFTTVGGLNDTTNQGRGNIALSWAAAPAATGYTVYAWDGVKYDQVASTSATTWNSSGMSLFPTDTVVAGLTKGGFSGNPFTTYGSRDLRDDPNALYNKMLPTGQSTADSDYRFRVVPYNTGGAPAVADNAELRVTLDGRTQVSNNEDPEVSTTDFGSWAGVSAGAELNSGTLTASATDLAVSSYGPEAAVSRSYRSDKTAAGDFAPGWFFAFRQNLAITSSTVTYTDAERREHKFVGSGTSWTAPNGFYATLTKSGSDWVMTFNDQTVLKFDSAGVLVSETDRNGNAVTYVWASGNLTITAPNAEHIHVTFSGGKVTTAAETETVAGQQVTREVDYTTASPWKTTTYPSVSGIEKQLTYGYDANTRLNALTLANWPSSGQSAVEGFTYNGSGKISEVDFADWSATTNADAKTTVDYPSSTSATVKRCGTVDGSAHTVMNQVTTTWDVLTGLADTEVAGTTTPVTTDYSYADDHQLAGQTSVSGSETVAAQTSAIDDHNITSSITADSANDESVNQQTTYVYDSLHRVTSETSYQAPGVSVTTSYAFDGVGNVTQESRQKGDGTWLSCTQSTYDSAGRTTDEKQLISGTPTAGSWAETQYSSFAANGAPQTTIAKAVKLTHGTTTGDLTQTATYDAFGNRLTISDWAGTTTENDTFDIAGNQLTGTDAVGLITHTDFDNLGNATATWQTVSGNSKKADWSTTSHDAMGRGLTVTAKLSDSSGNPTTQSVVTNTFDGSGHQLSSTDSTNAGAAEKWLYDELGNVTKHWALGVRGNTSGSDDARAMRSAYDSENRVTGTSAPGSSATPGSVGSTITAYGNAGQEISVTGADGSTKSTAYDGTGNVTSETLSVSSSTVPDDAATNVKTSSYDIANRLTGETSRSAFATGMINDLLGRVTGATGGSQAQTQTEYNSLGWVLQTVDASGVTVSKTYDAHGNVTSQTVGNQGATTSTYDAAGKLLTKTDPNGNKLTDTFDSFGNLTEEKHEDPTPATLKDITTSYDSLGRPTSTSESVSGRTQSWTYPVNTTGGVQETITYSNQTSTAVNRNTRNIETSRTTTIGSSNTVTLAVTDDGSHRDTADRWTSASLTATGASAQTIGRGFDDAGHVTSQTGMGLSAAGSYTFDAATGQKTDECLPLTLGDAIDSAGVPAYGYTADRRLAQANVGGIAGVYDFDPAGNLAADTEGATVTSFAYDSADRLTQTTDGTTTTYYGWDTTNGWRTCQGPTASPTTSNEPTIYTYTKSGVSTSMNRLMRYQNSATSTDASYAYDASGQRTKTVSTVSGTTTTTTYAYDGLTLMSLSGTRGATTWRIDYLYDETGTLYGGVYRSPATSTSPTPFYAVTTDRGDVVELTDANGNAFAGYRYDAWGLPRGTGNYATGIWTQATTGSAAINSTLAGEIASRQVLRYASYAYDTESGLYYCSARFYDPATRQWTSADPAKADAEESAYLYCAGEPVGGVDPTGLTVYKNGQTSYVSVNKGDGSGNKVWNSGTFYYEWSAKLGVYVVNWEGANLTSKDRIFRWQMKLRDTEDKSDIITNTTYTTSHDKVIKANHGGWWYNENPKHTCWYQPGESGPKMRVLVWIGEKLYFGNWVDVDSKG